MTPQTDIVLPFHSTRQYPTEEHVNKCITSLRNTAKNFRLIFVDDASDDVGRKEIERLAYHFPESVLVHTHKQRWFTRAVNIGLRLVRTPWAVEINSDVVFEDGWLDELYAIKDELESGGEKVGLIGSVYTGPVPIRYVRTQNPDYVTGHCWLLNIKALKEAATSRGTPDDYLDERNNQTIHIRSDNFICYDLNRLGWSTIKSFNSRVIHVAGKSWGHKLERIPRAISEVDYYYGN